MHPSVYISNVMVILKLKLRSDKVSVRKEMVQHCLMHLRILLAFHLHVKILKDIQFLPLSSHVILLARYHAVTWSQRGTLLATWEGSYAGGLATRDLIRVIKHIPVMYCTLICPVRKVTNPRHILYALRISCYVMTQGRNFATGLETWWEKLSIWRGLWYIWNLSKGPLTLTDHSLFVRTELEDMQWFFFLITSIFSDIY